MVPNTMKIQHFERFDGRITTVQYTDERGHPTASSFAGWISVEEARRRIENNKARWAKDPGNPDRAFAS